RRIEGQEIYHSDFSALNSFSAALDRHGTAHPILASLTSSKPTSATLWTLEYQGPVNYLSCVKLNSVIHSDLEILGGTPVFVGTRVPVQSLFDHLQGSESIDDFLE